MKKMQLEPKMQFAYAMELFPQILQYFQQIGVCCVNSENEAATLEELCIRHGAEPESFLSAVNAVV